MTISGNITVTCNSDDNLVTFSVYDNNTPLSVELAQGVASFESIHNNKADAHKDLFDALIAVNNAQNILIASKADASAIPTKLSELTNDCNFSTGGTIGDATITFTQGGTTKGTITTNQTSNATIEFDAAFSDISETYVNGTSWYRVYSDGWCEQGGFVPKSNSDIVHTITFLKTFANTNYYFERGSDFSGIGEAAGYFTGSYGSKTASSINIFLVDSINYTGCYWQAKGYLAQGD